MTPDTETIKAILNEIREICEDELGEWVGVEPPYLPARLDAIHAVLSLIENVEAQL